MTNRNCLLKLCAIQLGLLLLSFLLPINANGQTTKLPSGSKGGGQQEFVVIEGDILVTRPQYEQIEAQRRNPSATYIPPTANLWTNGIVPFQFDANVSAANQTAMTNAMRLLEDISSVDFQQCAGNSCTGDFVHIQNSSDNHSFIGRVGGRQVINIFNWNRPFIMAHELLHCVGFFHEHTRPDRDTFVDVAGLCANVTGGCLGTTYTTNFPRNDTARTYGSYDFDSVMHYGQCGFSTNTNCPTPSSTAPDGGITIRVRAPYADRWQTAIGQRDHLSALDQATLAILYPRFNMRWVDASYDEANGRSDGSFRRPYRDMGAAVTYTPSEGTVWVQPGVYSWWTLPQGKKLTIKGPRGGVLFF